MNFIKNSVQWGINPVPRHNRLLRGREFFVLWSSLGVGLLVFSAGSFLSDASFVDAFLAILIGSVGGSILLALAGKIGSDNAIPSLVSMRPSFGIRGSYLPAALNVVQLLGWTIFEITIMSTARSYTSWQDNSFLCLDYYIWFNHNSSGTNRSSSRCSTMAGKICYLGSLCIINHNYYYIVIVRQIINIVINSW